MTKIKLIFPISALLLAILACNFVAPTSATRPGNIPLTEAEVPRVSLEEAKLALESGNAIIVDVRGPEEYQESHIAGAISIPLGTIESNPASLELDKDEWIITYCT
jgi:3-mercaptopyruvate sulfurtransferase SseA